MKSYLRIAAAGAALAVSLSLCGCGSDEETTVVVGPPGPAGPAGPAGPSGPEGANGQLRIYGDGSAGAGVAVDGTILGETAFTNRNFQFTDFTVPAGVTLTVPSGTVIRCTGTFRNQGTIIVRPQASNGSVPFGSVGAGAAGASFLGAVPGPQGISVGGAAGPDAAGGIGGRNANLPQLPYVVVSPIGGGSGSDYDGAAGQGGGTFWVLARTAAINDTTGVINADGTDASSGGGGGGGGIVTLASQTRAENLAGGTITADGGDGGDADDSDEAGGGGGGGGLIQFLAPIVNIPGTESVAGGAGGLAGTVGGTTGDPRYGGGGGGASIGNGGDGGEIDTATDTGAAGTAGAVGLVFTSAAGADPTNLFKRD